MSPILRTRMFTNPDTLEFPLNIPENLFHLLGSDLKDWIKQLLDSLDVKDSPIILGDCHQNAHIEGRVFIAKGASVEPGAFIKGPAYIGAGSEVRHGAYIRGNVFIGANCVVGHTTEVKGACFLDGAKAGHFAYIGDSILGQHTNLGAGTKIANLKLNKSKVRYIDPDSDRASDSGLKKFGAILGDYAQTGCNSVLSPGSLLLPKTGVMPCHHFHGTLKHGIAPAR